MKTRSEAQNAVEEGRLDPAGLSRLTFEAVTAKYLQAVALCLRETTLKKERLFLVRPVRLFGRLRCDRITDADILRLQTLMKRDGRKGSYVNLVVGATARVLQFAKVWRRIQPNVKRLPERTPPVGRVLKPEEKEKLFVIAASRPAWLTAYSAAVIAVSTTLRGCELRSLTWRDIDLLERTVSVPDSKSDAGLRRIPLSGDAMAGFRLLRDRSLHLNAAGADSYVFPACENGYINPSRSQKSWRSAWRSLTRAAGLKGLRFHDMRHQCITELAEQGHADQTIMSIAGHLSRRMLEYYSHVRLDAKRKALESLPPITLTRPAAPQSTSKPN